MTYAHAAARKNTNIATVNQNKQKKDFQQHNTFAILHPTRGCSSAG